MDTKHKIIDRGGQSMTSVSSGNLVLVKGINGYNHINPAHIENITTTDGKIDIQLASGRNVLADKSNNYNLIDATLQAMSHNNEGGILYEARYGKKMPLPPSPFDES